MFLDFFAKIGWAWDLKQPSKELVKRVMLKNASKPHQHPTEIPEEENEKSVYKSTMPKLL